jgi:hypothetical protein
MQLRRSLLSSVVAALLSLSSAAGAAQITAEKNDLGEDYLALSGRIEGEDGKRFTQLALASEATVVFLESGGGSIEAAIEIGRVIRLKGMTTVVAHDDRCVSACGLIWLAGERRLLTPGARVGFHATYTTTDQIRRESGVGNALVGRYLTLLNLPERAVIFATIAGPNEINWLDATNKRASGIELEVLCNRSGGRAEIAAAAKTPPLTLSSLKQEPEQISFQK